MCKKTPNFDRKGTIWVEELQLFGNWEFWSVFLMVILKYLLIGLCP